MALFQSDLKDVLRKLSNKEFNTSEERDHLLTRLGQSEGLRARDVVWMLFRPDRALRDSGVRILQKLRDPETVDLFVAECKNKPEATVRAASAVLFSLGVPGTESRLVHLATATEKETKENREIQDAARKIILEAPVSKTLDPVLWQLATGGRPQDRPLFLARLGSLELDAQAVGRWQKLAREGDKMAREKALEVLATRAPASSIDLFVEQLPLAGYSTQQLIVGALTRAAAGQGVDFADRILPLIASGEAGTRSAILKILVGMPNRSALVKRYITFSKTLVPFARDRALESMRAFGDDLLEPTLELINDADPELRAAVMTVAGSFDDPRIVPATIALLRDHDWWIRVTAAENLGRLKDPRAVDALVAALVEPELRSVRST